MQFVVDKKLNKTGLKKISYTSVMHVKESIF